MDQTQQLEVELTVDTNGIEDTLSEIGNAFHEAADSIDSDDEGDGEDSEEKPYDFRCDGDGRAEWVTDVADAFVERYNNDGYDPVVAVNTNQGYIDFNCGKFNFVYAIKVGYKPTCFYTKDWDDGQATRVWFMEE
jgi:hypothetical protein